MAHKLKLALAASILFFTGALLGQNVLADPGGIPGGCGYFDGACGYNGGFNRVLINGINATNNKSQFISDIEGYLSSGSYRNESGAAFIIQTMRGNVNRARPPSGAEIQNWKDRINSGAITLSVEDYSYDWNSGWHNGPKDDFFYREPDTRESIVFRHNGNIVYVLKVDCGNSVGDFPGLPDSAPPPPPPPATGIIQGIKVEQPGARRTINATITLDGGSPTNANPYGYSNVPAGNHTVAATTPPGFMLLGYTLCMNNTNCHGNPPTPGSSVSFNLNGGEYADLWWHYRALVTIEGRVFNWKTQVPGGGYAGVQIETCGAGTVNTNGSGFFSFQRPRGEGYCVRPVGGGPVNAAGPFLRPWFLGYGAQNPACPGFSNSTASPLVNHGGAAGSRNFCKQTSYECMMAGVNQQNPFPGCPFSDRDTDLGFDIVYLPDDPPSLTLRHSCPARTVTINASDPDGAPVPVRYRIDGGSWTNVSVSGSFTINMPNSPLDYDYYNHTVEAETSGVGPVGTSPPASSNRSATVRYGNPASVTRACKDRGFTVTPQAGPVNLLPDEETATSVRFASNIDATITPPGGPTQVRGVFYDRRFFICRGGNVTGNTCSGVTINLNSPAPSSPDPRNTDAPFSAPMIDSGNINPVAQVGDSVCQTVTVRPTAGTIDTNGSIVSSNGVTQESPAACERVVGKPYFRVYNSDVSAGFITCPGWTTSMSNGTIIGQNKGTGQGSGTQLAAFAIDQINGFSSATGRTAAPIPPKGLTFSNVGAGTYGTGFGSGFCAHDYFGTRPAGLPTPPGGSSVNLSSVSSGNYTYTGNVQVGGNLGSGKKITLYVDGDVFIDSDIAYSGSWTSIADIPNFSLIVRGNVYIRNTVGNIDGLYVAQPNGGSGGSIYTCAFGAGSIPDADGFYDDCDTQLTVNGAFIAKTVRLMRTNGSLKDSANNENRTSGTMAERFIFSPEAWLSSSIKPGSGTEPYESITSISPVL